MDGRLWDVDDASVADLSDRITAIVARRRFAPPVYMELFLTEDCNQRCDYCFVRDKSPRRMSWEVARQAVDFLFSVSGREKRIGILFFGGEPLLEFPLIRRIVEHAGTRSAETGKQVAFDITTNGTLLDEEKMLYFRDHGVKYLLSIDGTRAVHDRHRHLRDGGSSHDVILSRFKAMKRHQPWQGARVTVHPDTADRTCESVRELFGLGFNQFIVGPAHSTGWDATSQEVFRGEMRRLCDFYLEARRKKLPMRLTIFELGNLEVERTRYRGVWGCGAGRGRICVGVDGDLYGCSKLMAMAGAQRPVFRMGDVWKGFTDLGCRMALNDSTARHRPACRTCDIADFCTGNCPATNFEATGSIYTSPELDCAFARIFHELNRYLLDQLTPADLELLGISHPEAMDTGEAAPCRPHEDAPDTTGAS